MYKLSISLLFSVMFLTVASCSQLPAPVENKSEMVFSRQVVGDDLAQELDNKDEQSANMLGKDIPVHQHEVRSQNLDDAYDEAPYKSKNSEEVLVKDDLDELPENNLVTTEQPIKPSAANFFKLSAPLGLDQFAWPIQGKLISRYGEGGKGFAEGISIGAKIGDPVKAAADGNVIYAENDYDKYGNLIIIQHKNNFSSAYAHNSELLVKRGQKVIKGQVIAKIGQSGNADSPRLYFSIRHNETLLDPEKRFQ
jgi:murein DD-endopeptidase MepM/ murein hydrolase activator NlpD